MKLDPKAFYQTIFKCGRFVALKDFIPSLKCLKLQGNKIYAIDGMRGIVLEDPNHDFGAGRLLPAEFLLNLLPKLDQESPFDLIFEEDHTLLKSGKYKTKISNTDEKGFTFPDRPDESSILSLDTQFFTAVKSVAFAMGIDETKKEMRGIGIESITNSDGKLINQFYGTDNYLIARYTSSPSTLGVDLRVTFPAILLDSIMDENPLGYSFMPDGKFWLWLESGALVCTVQINKAFPPCYKFYDKFLSENPTPTYYHFDKEKLLLGLDRMSLSVSGDLKPIRITAEENKLTFFAKSSLSDSVEELECKNVGTWSIRIGFDKFRACIERFNKFANFGNVLYFNNDEGLECLVLHLIDKME